jgi:adenine-specific DNA methylase
VEVRESLEVRAEAVSWDYARLEPFEDGADDYLPSVDAEIGIILRLASRLRGKEYDILQRCS